MRSAFIAILAVPLLLTATDKAAHAWGCKVFDASRDDRCPVHPDYVTKRVNFFCGENHRLQLSSASGDCRRDGVAFNLRKFSYHGIPAVTWNIEGRKSRATLATGCFCLVDE